MNRKYCERWLKSCLKKKVSITATTIIMFLMTGLIVNTPIYASVLIGNADGTNITPNGSTVSAWGITIGGAVTKAGDNSVHIGDATGSVGTRNVVIGTYASAGYNVKNPSDPEKDGSFNQSVAIGAGKAPGEGARAYGDQSIAIGSNTIARGNSSIAIGNDDVDKTDKINTTYTNNDGNRVTDTIGNAYNALTGKNLKWDGGQYADTTAGEAAVAVGVKSEAGDISLALGTAAKAKVVNGVAIGSGATANRDNAVAIGGGSTTDAAGTKETEITINKLTFKWAGGDRTVSGDVVSFGKDQFERQLKHVAPGAVSATSTDAINGSQLHGVLTHLIEDPVFMFGADDSDKSNVVGDTPQKKQEDGETKKIVARSISDSRLNLRGGADKDKLSENNIGVTYEDTSSIRFRLSKELAGLTSAEFKNTAGDITTINGDGVTITPVANGKKPVSVTKNGLNNGGNVIANVAGNLEGAKPNSTEPTTNATVPTDVDSIKNNAATVGDVLNAGWNLQNNGKAKDFVKPYDTVNFADGNGTTAVVDTEADRSTSKIKYNVNLGNGLQKDAATNKITVKTADESLTVDADGLKAKTDNATITTGDSGLKVVTGKIESGTTPGTMKVKDGDAGKIATVDSVVKAVNSAAFTLKASATTGGTRNGSSTVEANGEAIKAGSTIEMIAGKNLDVKHDENGKITFATVENPSFKTVQVGGDQGPKFSKTSDGNIKVSDKDGENPVKITNVKDGAVNENSKDAINGSQFHKLANNTIKLAGKNGSDAATETDVQNLNQQDGIKFTVKSSDGKLLEVTAGGDTITLTPKTGTITTTNGVPTANTTNGKLVTADQIVNALTEMGWKATADKDGTGTVEGNAEELIKAGNTVTFKAGNNLSIKQDGKNFIYSLNTALSGLTSAEFKDDNKNKVNITPTGITITKPAGTTENTVTLNQDGLNNGGNLITNVASNLEGAKTGTTAPTTKAAAPNDVVGIKNNAATVGDVLNAGWNLQGNGEEKDFVKPYDTVNFANGDGTTATVETTNNKVSTVKYSVNLGNGLKKDDTGNTISIKPADKSLEVNKDGVKVKTDGTTITTDDNKGLKVVTGAIESVTTGNDSGTVKVKEGDTGKIATVDSVVNAVNSAAFTLKASATTGGTRNGSSSVGENGEDIKAGKTIEMIAGKNLNVTHNENGKIIFATVDTPTFSTVQVGGDQGPKFSKTSDGDIKVSDKDGANPVKVTNVKDGAVTDTSTDAINGSQFHKVANNTIKLAGQNGDDATTATQTKEQNLNKQGGIKFTVKSSDGKLLEVKAADDTITLTPKTATITTGEDGIPTANIDSGKLVTAEDLVTALKNMGWKATAGKDGTGTVTGAASELIKAGETVTFKAGNNLAVKQAGKEFIYSLKQELTDLTKVEVKDADGNKVVTTPTGTTVTDKDGNVSKLDGTGLTITPNGNTSVSVTKDGIKAGDKAITNVASNLTNYDSGNKKGLVDLSKIDTTPNSNVATVGDLRNMGWVVSSNKTTDALETEYNDKVKNADEVKFVGTGAATVSGKTDNKGVRTITVDVTVPDVEKGTINAATTEADKGKVVANKGDGDKFTTVDTVVNAINSAAWKVTSDKEGTGNTATIGHTQSKEEIKAGDTVTFKAGDNLIIKQSGKEFTYSLNPELTNLSKVEVKDTAGNAVVTTPTGTTITGKDTTDPTKDITTVINAGGTTVTDKDGNTTKVDGNGITITSKNDPANPVKLTKDGLDNGRNTITNVKSNLPEETNDNKLKQDKPTNINNNNAATVGDVLNAGWNLQNNGTAKDFVRPYDTVNFINGDGTTATVETTDNKVSKIKYDVNTGNGLEKTTDNKIAIKPADKSLEVTNDGLKVKAGDNTLTTDTNGLKVNTGTINPVDSGDKAGTVAINTNDKGKIATVDTVVNAINNASFTLKASATTDGTRNAGSSVNTDGESIKAGNTVELIAGKNLDVKHDTNGKITFATRDDVSFNTVQVGGDQGPKLSKTDDGSIKVSDKDGTKPVKITNVKDGNVTEDSKDAINGSQFHKVAKNTIKLAGQNGVDNATETDGQDLDKTGGIKFTVKSSDGKLLDVVAAGDTITLTPKTATLTSTNGVPQADTTNGKLVTADDLITTLKGMGWKAIADKDGTGTVEGNAAELIKAGETVTFKAGNNLKIKQDGKNFIYSLNPELTGLTSAEFKDTAGNTSKLDVTGLTITPNGNTDPNKNVSITKDGINAGDKAITNVASNLTNYNTGNKDGLVNLSNTTTTPNSNVATVGDLRNMGWVVSSDKTTNGTGEYSASVKNANEVKFVGKGAATVSGKTDAKGVRTITVEVNDQVSTNNSVTPVVYTKADGTKVYPVKNPTTQNIEYHTTPDGKGEGDQVVPNDQVITSVNGPEGTTTPTTLKNIAGNLPKTHSDTKDLDGTTVVTPTTSQAKPDNIKNIVNNAATVGDVLNAGWNLKANGTAVDFVKPYDTVEFKNGVNTTVIAEASKDGKSSTIKVDVKDNLKNITSISNEGAKDENGNPIPENKVTKIALGTDANGNKTVDVGEAKITNVADGNVTDTSKDAVNGSQLKAVKDEAEKHTTLSVNGGDKDKAGNNSPVGNLVITETTNDKGGKHYDVKLADKVTFGTDDTKAVTVDGTTGKITAGKGENGIGIDGTKAEIKAGDGANAVTINGKEGKVTVGDNITLNNADKSATIGDVKVNGKDGHITGLKNKDWTIGTTQPVSGRAATEDQLKKLEDGIVDKIDNLGWEATVGKEGTGKSEPDAKNNKETVRVDHTTNVHYQAGDNLIVKEEIIRAKDAAGKDTDKVSDAKYTYRLNDEITLHNVTVKPKDGKDGAFTVQNTDGKDAVSIKPDVDGNGTMAVNGKDGTGVSLNGKDGSIGINGKDGVSVSMTTEKGPKGLDEENKKPRMTYEFTKTNPDGTPVLDPKTNKPVTVKENLATMNDGLHFAGDNNVTTISKKLNEKLEIVGGADRDKLTKNNIGVNANAEGKLEVQLSKELKGMTSAEFTDPKTGDTVIMNQGGITISKTDKDGKSNNVSLTREGLNNGGNNITNVKGNLPQVNDGDKTVYDPATGITKPADDKNTTKAPITATEAADIIKKAGNNAATVGDVLNAGWNLQNNGTAKDFVKPYDTVNFINGGNTTAVVTTNAEGTTSNVTYNVTGLPITYTNEEGKPVSKVGDNYYVVNEKGQPLQNDGTPVTKYDVNGNPLNNDGTPVKKVDTSANPLTINLVNPNVSADKSMTTPMRIGNIESGAKTFEAKVDKNGNPLIKVGTDYYTADQLDKNGQPKAGEAPKTDIQDIKMGKDGKWYPADSVLIDNKYYPAGSVVSKNGNVYPAGTTLDQDGNPTTEGIKPVTEVKPVATPKNSGKAGLVDFSSSNSTNAATVGDLQNMGWVVSTSDTGYNDQVRNTNVVDFKEGEGIKISGETLENGVRQIKVGIDKNVVATKQELSQVARLSSAGIAGVAAMANIPQINEAASNRYNIAVGVGYHKGEKALAVGISGVSDGGRVVYKASAAMDSQRQTTVGLGVGYQFGKRDIEPNELDRFRAQLDLVNTQKSSLAQKLKEETHKVKELNNKVEELEKQNKMLNEKMDLILKKLGGK